MAIDETAPGENLDALSTRLRDARIRRYGPASAPSRREQAAIAGMHGERILGAILDAAADEHDLHVLHSLPRRPRGDIDHVVIGPAGVTVVDAKYWTGRVTTGRGTLWNGRHPKTDAIDGVAGQVSERRALLDDRGGHDVEVAGLLCLVRRNDGLDPRSLTDVGAIAVGQPEPVVAHVSRPGPLTAARRAELSHLIATAFHGAPAPQTVSEPLVVPADWAKSAQGRRQRPRRWRSLHRATLAFFAFLVLAVIGTTMQALEQRQAPSGALRVNAGDLREELPALRALAARRAGGAVRGPRLVRRTEHFRLVYRHGRRCLVLIDVPRNGGPVLVRSSGCREGR